MVELTLKRKLEVIGEISGGSSYRKISKKYGISVGTVTNINKNKARLLEQAANNESIITTGQKRLVDKPKLLDDRVFQWFIVARSKQIPISGPLICEKALAVGASLGMSDFKASNGWLECFRKRHNINFKMLSGESVNLDHTVVQDWKSNLQTVLYGYDLKDVFNCDETGLFWRGVPNRTMALKSDQCKGGKLAKERLTVMLTVSAVGEKLKPFVIGRAKMPRSFNKKLPHTITWRSNSKAWMLTSLMEEYLKNLNHLMLASNRNILLLLDNAPVHPSIELSNVKLVFLPPNTTAGTQPLDAGIIKSFKYHYRKQLLKHMVFELDESIDQNASDWVKSINVAHAVNWIKNAWNSVTSETIVNCFRHCGIVPIIDDNIVNQNDENDLEEHLIEMLSALGIQDGVVLEDLETFDLADRSTDVDWENNILFQEVNADELNVNHEDDDIESAEQILTTWSEAKSAMNTLSNYCTRDSDLLDAFGLFKDCLARYNNQNLKQAKISVFFQLTPILNTSLI